MLHDICENSVIHVVSCLVFRETDIRKCFKHENQKYPPALSSSVKLKQGGSDLVGFLETQGDSAVTRIPCMWK